MRFFYVRGVKRTVLLSFFVVFLITLTLQLIPALFIKELSAFAMLKTRLGYPITFFPNNTLLPLRILFSIFYAFIGGFLSLFYYKMAHKRSGQTLLISKSFQTLTGIMFLILLYALLHSELFVINPIKTPNFSLSNPLTAFLPVNLRSFFIPQVKVDPPVSPKYITYPKPPQTSQNNSAPGGGSTQNQNPNQPPPKQPKAANPPSQATPWELYTQLNSYRTRNGKGILIWDGQLVNYAQQRANLYASLGATDSHAGFSKDTSAGLNYQFGFYGLAENSSFGATGDARYLIEDWFEKSAAHNNNMLNAYYTHVGIGVNGQALDFIFGGGKIDKSNTK